MGSIIGRKEAPVILTAIFGIMMILNFFLDIPTLASVAAESQRMFIPIVSAATLVGATTLVLFHIKKVTSRKDDRATSAILLVTFFFFLIFALLPGYESAYSATYSIIVGRLYEATWALISLFMVSMAYRAFQVKSFETLLFAVSCIVVLFGNAPIGEAIFPGASGALKWLMDIPSMAGMRAITIGVGLGVVAYGVRVMLGYDRTALGEFAKEE